MTSINVQFVAKSSNVKVGKMPITNSDRHSCPDSCALKDNGCYASSGFHTRLNWDKVTSGERGGPWEDLCDKIASLPDGQVWRHNVSGDLPHNDQLIDMDKLHDLVAANTGKRGFTYTHHDSTMPHNVAAVRAANRDGFVINLSADNPAMADELKKHGLPVVSIVPETQLENFTTDAGHKVVICPAVTKDDVSCLTCKMCAVQDRKTIIGFPAHGTGKGKIEF